MQVLWGYGCWVVLGDLNGRRLTPCCDVHILSSGVQPRSPVSRDALDNCCCCWWYANSTSLWPDKPQLIARKRHRCSRWNQTACADFPNVVAQRHISVGAHLGAMTPKVELGRYFIQCTYLQVSSSIRLLVRKLWCVDKQTNTQTDAAENINALRHATTLGKNSQHVVWQLQTT